MSGAPRVRSMNVAESEARPVLGPAGNKALAARKPSLKPVRKLEKPEACTEDEKKKAPTPVDSPPVSPLSAPAGLRRQELLLHSNLSMNASCSSDASTDSFRSRASTGRIERQSLASRRRLCVPRTSKIAAKLEKIAQEGAVVPLPELSQGKRRCSEYRTVLELRITNVTLMKQYGTSLAWTSEDICYAAFHDEEWGVPVHDDRKLFELLVLSGALAELTWPAILSKRHIFREVFMDFDPLSVSKLNEKKLIAIGGIASSLLSEPKLRAVLENARQILKIKEEFGSFDRYCWSFVNHKPITSRFRYPRQVPVKTPKADVISKDLVRRGFRSVGPTVIYSFMQAAGITNDHLISCYKFDECAAAVVPPAGMTVADAEGVKATQKTDERIIATQQVECIDLELSRAVDGLRIT